MSEYKVSSQRITDVSQLQQDWLDLQSRSHCRYFQSWGWIRVWLQLVGIESQAIQIRVCRGDALLGLGLFVPATFTRSKIVFCNTMFLNEYPLTGNDMVMEYNGLLAQAESESAVYQQVLLYLEKKFPGIDEFNFGALSSSSASFLQQSEVAGLQIYEQMKSVSWQVDLTKFSANMDAYLASLSSNSRAQIRYSQKHYEKNSPVTLLTANSVEQALIFFDELKKLHIKRWHKKNKRHAFSDEKWEAFHRLIIRERFASGEIQMIKIANEHQDIAYLFNYLWQKRVYVLQMGFNYSDNKRVKPGYLAHAMAIVYNANKTMQVYDFMHGYSRYKHSLSDLTENLHWYVAQRPRLKFRFEKMMRRAVRLLRK